MGISIRVWGWNHRFLFHIYHPYHCYLYVSHKNAQPHTPISPMFHDVLPAGTSRHNDLYWSCSDLAGVAGLRNGRWVMKKDLELRNISRKHLCCKERMQRLIDVYLYIRYFSKYLQLTLDNTIVMFGNGSRLLVQRVIKTDMLPTCCATLEGCFDA